MKNNISQIGISFVLFTLLLFKVSSFHVYTHHDDTSDAIENCSVCDLAFQNQGLDYLIDALQTIAIPASNFIAKKIITSYESLLNLRSLGYSFFGRPPPLYY